MNLKLYFATKGINEYPIFMYAVIGMQFYRKVSKWEGDVTYCTNLSSSSMMKHEATCFSHVLANRKSDRLSAKQLAKIEWWSK